MAAPPPDPGHPRRRSADSDRRRWNDDRLDDLMITVRAIQLRERELHENTAAIKVIEGDLDDFKGWIREVEGRLRAQINEVALTCKELHAAYKSDADAREQSEKATAAERRRGRLVLAAATIGGVSALLAAVIGAYALLSSAPG